MVFTDPVGNVLNVSLIKDGDHAFFTDGWKHVGAFYGIQPAGWLRMVYTSLGNFSIEVSNQWGDKITYPPMPESLESGDSAHPIILDVDDAVLDEEHVPHIVDRSKCITEFKKWLSFDEILGNKLVSLLQPQIST